MEERTVVEIDEGRCLRCGACLDVCPQRVLRPDGEGPPSTDPEAEGLCIRCGHCAAACAPGALSHREVPSPLRPAPPPPSPESVLAWLEGRRSARAYRADPVPAAAVRELLEGARYAPTGHN